MTPRNLLCEEKKKKKNISMCQIFYAELSQTDHQIHLLNAYHSG